MLLEGRSLVTGHHWSRDGFMTLLSNFCNRYITDCARGRPNPVPPPRHTDPELGASQCIDDCCELAALWKLLQCLKAMRYGACQIFGIEVRSAEQLNERISQAHGVQIVQKTVDTHGSHHGSQRTSNWDDMEE